MTDNNKKTHLIVTGRGGGSGEQVQADWNQSDNTQPDYIKNKPELATVATSGDYDDLTNKPTIPEAQVQADWQQNDSSAVDYIKNKPSLPSAQIQSDWNQTNTSEVDYIKNKPTIPAAQVNADWNSTSGVSEILNKPSLATVATSGNYSDLNGTPSLATVATSGDYDDLQNKPTIPAAPVQSDWNEADSSSLAYIANKPTIPAAQVNSDWNAVSGVAQILNKPTIPTVPAMATETLTFTLQGGTTKTIEFYTVPNYFYVEDVSGSNNTLSITKNNSTAPTIEVFKSTDKTNWESMGTTSTTAITATIPANGKLYLKANANTLWCGNAQYNTISASGNHNVGGNILSLIYGDNFDGKTTLPTTSYSTHSGFTQLFYNDTKLINANNLILPLTTTIKGVYNGMFWGCTNLVTAPSELPAATLADSCYTSMFRNCTSLTTAPVILSTTTVDWCASSMFNGCTSLNNVTCYFTSVSPSGCITNWLNNVAATGDFYNLGGATYTSGDPSGIPSGWTEHTSL